MNFLTEICTAAFAALKNDFQALIRRIAMPVLLLLGGGVLTQIGGAAAINSDGAPQNMGLILAGIALVAVGYLMLLISVHRHVLSTDSANDGMGMAMFLYSTWSLGIGFVAALIAFPVIAIAGSQAALLAIIPVAYVISRLTLILPDRALGRRTDMGEIWQYSQGNGWKLTMIIVGIPVLINVLLSVLVSILPTGFAAALSSLLNLPILVFDAALVSVAYRDLRQLHIKNSDTTPI